MSHSVEQKTLAVNHLRKLFSELIRNQLSTADAERNLYKMLPLFHKVASICSSDELIGSFKEFYHFTSAMAKLFVSEVKKRAANQSTEIAAVSVADFLSPEPTENPIAPVEMSTKAGWQLLNCLRVLISTNNQLVARALSEASVPSTLAKSLYLFYDLPEPSALSNDDKMESNSYQLCRGRMSDVFVELMSSVVSWSDCVEEMCRRDDLSLLITALTSCWCPPWNSGFRQATSQVLMTIASRSLTPLVLAYLHNKNLVEIFITNLKINRDLTVAQMVDTLVCLFCLLKDSSLTTAQLLTDLKSAGGYQFLTDFILRNELDESQECQDALRNLLLMLASFVTVGHGEIANTPPPVNSLYFLPNFSAPIPVGQGVTARNTAAFAVLQNLFIKSETESICSCILDVISSVYSADPSNYFLLDNLCTLGQLAEVIFNKPKRLQVKFYDLLEFVVFHLNFVPCRELIALSVNLKTQIDSESAVTCVHSLFKILSRDPIFRDVYREVGLLESILHICRQFCSHLTLNKPQLSEFGKNLALLSIDLLTLLIKSNPTNAAIFRELNGLKSIETLIGCEESRLAALQVVQQLLLIPGSDDELTSLLGLIHTAKVGDVPLKSQILKSLLYVLRESHRVRLIFRRVGGFLYVISTLVTLEGALSPQQQFLSLASDSDHARAELLELIRLVFKVITVAMRFEPANARFFEMEVRYSSLTESLRLLGCFNTEVVGKRDGISLTDYNCETNSQILRDSTQLYARHFNNETAENISGPGGADVGTIPQVLLSVCRIVRMLYDMALDNYEKPQISWNRVGGVTIEPSGHSSLIKADNNNSLSPVTDCLVVHPGAVSSILQLLPTVTSDENPVAAVSLQVFMMEVVKSLMRTERNQQVMCDFGLPREIFHLSRKALQSAAESPSHPLLPPLHYIIERLAAQSMQPRELREFLRLDLPLCCQDLDDPNDSDISNNSAGGPVRLSRVKTLVSMMTPRDYRLAGVSQSPPFVEFDMSVEGFGCIFLPSIAPQSQLIGGVQLASVVPTVSSSSGLVEGGLGAGDRVFPPLTGLSVLMWIYTEKFSDTQMDSHPIRLLTVIRSATDKKSAEDTGNCGPELACLTIQISPIDRALVICTDESNTPGADLDQDSSNSDYYQRILIPELRLEQQWCHLAIVFSRAVLKNSTVAVYLNGRLQATEKIHYVIQNLGGAATTLTSASSINAIIGTPPGPLRKQSQLQWRLGTTHLLEDSCQPQFIQTAFRLGPHYTGNFQCCQLNSGSGVSLISEERVIFALNGQSVSQMTVAKMRKIYNKFDSRIIAKLLGLSSHENATPIRLLHNSSAHLNGPARSIGGVLVGYLGMRSFCPRPVSKLLESVGGISALLGLVAMAVEGEGLYAAIKALLCGIRSNAHMATEMNRTRGYQTLAVLLKEKSNLLNSHILHLIFSLVGTLDSCRDSTSIPNIQAFDDLLCNLELWRITSSDLQRLLFEHFYELITESGDQQKTNLQVIRSLGLLGRLLKVIRSDPDILLIARDVLFNLLAAILQPLPDSYSLLKFGQFIASTLPTSTSGTTNGVGVGGEERSFPSSLAQLQNLLFPPAKLIDSTAVITGPNLVTLRNLYLRNRCLAVLLNMLVNTGGPLNYQLCDMVVRVLGYDWVLQLFTEDLHDGTVAFGLRILSCLVSHQPLLQRFKDGGGSGGWLSDTESVVQNRAGVLLGFSVSCYGGSVGSACDINPEICHTPGFQVLSLLAPNYAHLPDTFLSALSILVGQPAKDLPLETHFNLDSVWTQVFHIPVNHSVADGISRVELCPEAVTVLLSLIRRCLNTGSTEAWALQYPQTLLQFLTFLYHNISDFTQFCLTEEFLAGLIATLFPETPQATTARAVAYEASTDATENNEEAVVVRSNPSISVVDHPAKKAILDLIRNILVDSFPLSPISTSNSLTDVIIEMSPEWPCRADTSAYVTAVLLATSDHLVASDALLHGSAASLPAALVVGSNFGILAANIFYFTSRLVDTLWSGLFTGDPTIVFQFIIKLISQGKRKGGIALDSLYRSLNRTILFLLSRSMDTISARNLILDTLHKITANRGLIFAQLNGDLEFFASLSHLLFLLTLSEPIDSADSCSEEETRIRESSVLIANSARRVWEEMYITKKQSLEEQLKTPLVAEINAARSLVGESVNRLWQTYLDGEMKGGSHSRDSSVPQLHSQLQSKIQKMAAAGLSRLASRKSIRPQSTYKTATISYQTLTMWMGVHRSLIRELVRIQHLHSQQSTEHVDKFVLEDWRAVEQELTRERGLWGPNNGSVLDKWQLDSTEGPCRMRKKLIQNEIFYIQYPFRPNLDLADFKPLKYKVAVSKDSRLYYERIKAKRAKTLDPRIYDLSKTVATPSEEKPFLLRDLKDFNPSLIRRFSFRHEESLTTAESNNIELDTEMASLACGDNQSQSETQSISTAEQPEVANEAGQMSEKNDKNKTETSREGPDNQTLLRLLEEGEELQSMFRCARVNGLDTREGLLLFGREHYYVVDGYTLLKTREIRDLNFLPEELHDPIIPYTACGGAVRIKGLRRICSKFPYEDVREVHKRRYLLQPIALEVFSADGRNNLLAFPKKMRNKVYSKFLSVAKSITDTDQSVSGQKSSANVEAAGGLLSNLIGETSVTQRWVRGEISNFQYLMALNTLAGRSYNDLMQYPVFPWILADYDSEELDLTDPATFRDLSAPMGAQNADRLEQFLKRYREWDDPTGETPPYMYGTHYSSAMIVVSYLVRVEPFTQHFLKLQGGHFDLADRMFHSIRELWISASRNNMADVKELIPEFFYLPDFLVNSNNFDFGAKQSGIPLGDVVLPPWAKDSPREFIRLHREALESDFVSSHLHEWIDLIFGYKQTGQAAIEANNLFHHLFYEGNVDFEAIEDPLTRAATIGFINNFGQIPSQLFKRPHPAKKLKLAEWSTPQYTRGVTTDRLFYHSLDSLKPPSQPIKELRGAVGQIVQSEKGLITAVEQNKVAIPPGYQKFFAWGFADQSLRLGTNETEKSSCILELSDCGQIVCSTCPNSRTAITGGTSTVVSVWDICQSQRGSGPISLRLRKSLYGHTESISCLTSNGAYGVIVSGSQDRSVIIWDLSSLSFIRQLAPHPSAVSAVAINESTGDIASASGTHLFLWSINGQLVAKVNTATSPKVDAKQLILAVCFSSQNDWDGQHVVVTGSNDGVVRMWSCEYVQVPLESTDDGADKNDKTDVEHKEINAETLRLRLLSKDVGCGGHHRLNSNDESGPLQFVNSSQSPNDTFSPPTNNFIQSGSDSGLGTPVLPRSASEAKAEEIADETVTTVAPRQGSNESFLLINSDGLAGSNRLRSGFQWRPQLVFRSKLTLHTAMERKDNPNGAAITALATTRDNKSLLVGDSRGRVWQWQVGEVSGGRVDHWVLDTTRQSCYACQSRFSFKERRHHCRNCGQIFCAKCSRFESEIKQMKISKPVRVCQQCYLKLKELEQS